MYQVPDIWSSVNSFTANCSFISHVDSCSASERILQTHLHTPTLTLQLDTPGLIDIAGGHLVEDLVLVVGGALGSKYCQGWKKVEMKDALKVQVWSSPQGSRQARVLKQSLSVRQEKVCWPHSVIMQSRSGFSVPSGGLSYKQ